MRPLHLQRSRPVRLTTGSAALCEKALGSDVIDGVNVAGTRETITISAGVVGNAQPLVTTREFWYSPDLQVNLSITRKDPREGTQVIPVGDLSRREPDPAMFQVPAGFVVRNLGGLLSEPMDSTAKSEN